MAFIRQYRPSDFDDMANICRMTLAPDLTGSEAAWRLAPYIWTHQYTHLSPATCFVVDDGAGRAVGYCIGCPSVDAFVEGYGRYVDEVLEPSAEVVRPGDVAGAREPWLLADSGKINETCLAQTAYNPRWLLVEGNEDVLGEGYRATMHVDLLESWQGKGWGRRLVERFVKEVRARRAGDCRGIGIGVASSNRKVVAFYEKLGFREWEEKDPEASGIRMVKDL
ncbi:hypothetical protein V2G26_008776 [Clonostachys chloroleuca]